MLGYKPEGMEMWDAWAIEHEGRLHLFHLQFLSQDSSRTQIEADCLGHATSENLVDWTTAKHALAPGPAGALDDMQPWTGTVYKHEDTFYLYYTMRSTSDQARGQHIGLATSKDLSTWLRHPDNPVISPDSRWYVSHEQPLPNGVVDCRDLVVVKDPQGRGWYGFYAGRTHAEELSEGSVIALVRSDDLIHWEHLPPAFVPSKYACIEVPEVFAMNGRWYMTCLTAHGYGNRGIYKDKAVVSGTVYAVADRLEGPYQELEEDQLLLGGDSTSGYSFRSFLFKGKRYGFYTDRVTNTLSPPMEIRTTPEGYLRLGYSGYTGKWRKEQLLHSEVQAAIEGLPLAHTNWGLLGGSWRIDDSHYVGEARKGWQIADVGQGSANVELEAVITLHEGVAAGLTIRNNKEAIGCTDDLVIMLDAAESEVRAGLAPNFGEPWVKNWPIGHGIAYKLRVVVRRPRIEVYVDDILVLQFSAAIQNDPQQPGVGVFVDRARTSISQLIVYSLLP